jgi:hypothetical protein
MTVPDRQLVTTALVSMVASSTGKAAGDHKAPAARTVGQPYVVVYSIAGGGFWGPGLTAPDASADLVYQLDAVGATRAQAEWMGDAVRRTLLARTNGAFQVAFPAVSGWVMADREPSGGPGGIGVEGVPPNEVFTVAERYTLRLTPA